MAKITQNAALPHSIVCAHVCTVRILTFPWTYCPQKYPPAPDSSPWAISPSFLYGVGHHMVLVPLLSSRMLVFDWRAFAVLRSTYSLRVTTYVGKPSAQISWQKLRKWFLTSIATPPKGRPYKTPVSTHETIAEDPKHWYEEKLSSNFDKLAGVSQCSCSNIRFTRQSQITHRVRSLVESMHIVRYNRQTYM